MNKYKVGDVLTRGFFHDIYGEMRVEEITERTIVTAFHPQGFDVPLVKSAPVAIEGLTIEPLNRKEDNK